MAKEYEYKHKKYDLFDSICRYIFSRIRSYWLRFDVTGIIDFTEYANIFMAKNKGAKFVYASKIKVLRYKPSANSITIRETGNEKPTC